MNINKQIDNLKRHMFPQVFVINNYIYSVLIKWIYLADYETEENSWKVIDNSIFFW